MPMVVCKCLSLCARRFRCSMYVVEPRNGQASYIRENLGNAMILLRMHHAAKILEREVEVLQGI